MQKKNFLVIKHKRYLYKKLCKNSLKPKTSSRKRIYSKYMRIKKYLKKIITKKRTRKLRKILYIFAYRKRMRLFLRYRIAKLPLRDKFTRFIRKRLRKLFIIAKRNKNTIKNILYTMRYDRHDDIYKPEKASKRARYYHFKAEFVIFQKLKITKKNAEDIQIKMTQKFIKYQRILLARKIKRKLHEIIENWIKKCYAKKEFLESKFIKEINKKLPKPITAKKLAFVLTQYVSENLTTGYKKNKPYKNNNKYNKNKKKILKRKKQIIPQRYNQKKPKFFKRRVRKQATRLAKQVGLRMFSFKRFLRQKGMRNIYYIRMLKKYVLTEKKIQIEKNLGTFLIELNKINDKLSIQGWLQLYTQLNSRNIRFKEFPTEINPRIFHYYRKRAITVFKTFLSAIKVAQFYVTKKDEKKMIKRLKFRLFHEILCKKKGGQLSITKTKKKFYKQNISSTQLTFNKKPKQLVKELIDDIQHRFIKKKICKEYTNFLQKKKTTNVCNSFFYRNIYLENFFNNNKLVEKKDFSLNKITNYKKIKETEAYSKTIKYYLSTQNKIRKKKNI